MSPARQWGVPDSCLIAWPLHPLPVTSEAIFVMVQPPLTCLGQSVTCVTSVSSAQSLTHCAVEHVVRVNLWEFSPLHMGPRNEPRSSALV